MRSGELRHRVTIERHQTWLDSWGHQSGWRSVGCVWASVVAKSGGERFDAATSGVNTSTTFEVRMRFRSDVDSDCRFNYAGRVLDVVSVTDPDGRQRELVATCVQHGNEAEAA